MSVDFLIRLEQYANTCMVVLIRRATCEVLSCKIYLRGLRPHFFHGGSERLCLFLNCDQVSNLFKEFSGNLHFPHYAQGKYVIERKFMYL